MTIAMANSNLQEDILNIGLSGNELTINEFEVFATKNDLGKFGNARLFSSIAKPELAFCFQYDEEKLLAGQFREGARGGFITNPPLDFDLEFSKNLQATPTLWNGELTTLIHNGRTNWFLTKVKQDCTEIAQMYQECARIGCVSWEAVNTKIHSVMGLANLLFVGGSPEQPSFTVFAPENRRYAYLENELLVKSVLIPVTAGHASNWTRIRICEECGRYFFYKLERAKFCSTACRITAGNRKRRKK